jgi:tellurite resistance protein TehA-like permease
VVFCFDIVLLTTLTAITTLRFTLWPAQWSIMINHPMQYLFIGAWPMGFSQVIILMVYLFSPIWGHWITYLAWAMWIFDTALSVLITIFMPFLHMKVNTQRELANFTALEMFPFLAPIVASGTGAIVSTALPDPQLALATVIVSYVLLGLSMPITFIVTGIYMQRLMLHKLPPRTVIISVFLPLGPPCMTGLAAIILGQTCLDVFPKTHVIHPQAGIVFYGLGVLWAFVLWGFASLWFGLAIITVYYTRRFEFNLGWWACTFPVALFASVSIKIGEVVPSKFFRVVGAILVVFVVLLWMIVSAMTVRGIISGAVFDLPASTSTNGGIELEKDGLDLAEDVEKDD